MLGKLLASPTGKVIMSIIWGLGLAALFRRACTGRSCIVYKSPHPSKIQGRIFKHNGQCYKYTTRRANCDTVEENNVRLDREVNIDDDLHPSSSK